jgi:hypothetical protein
MSDQPFEQYRVETRKAISDRLRVAGEERRRVGLALDLITAHLLTEGDFDAREFLREIQDILEGRGDVPTASGVLDGAACSMDEEEQ